MSKKELATQGKLVNKTVVPMSLIMPQKKGSLCEEISFLALFYAIVAIKFRISNEKLGARLSQFYE